MERYDRLRISRADDLVFGRSPRPLAVGGLTIGGGIVYPELNFTLPPMAVTAGNHARGSRRVPADDG